jgi:hypothetical protein
MAETIVSLDSQDGIDAFLDRNFTITVETTNVAPLPSNQAYAPLAALTGTGFSFQLRDLLHSAGTRFVRFPLSSADAPLQAAGFLLYTLDPAAAQLCFLGGIDSDTQRVLSEGVGVGVAYLLAERVLGIPRDQIGSIPGPGKRFDIRGKSSVIRAILEAKGTKYREKQKRQIEDGIAKKAVHHALGESYDVELIVSTHVGTLGNQPRILLADPENDGFEWEFSAQGDKFFRLRHYAKLMQFIGAPALARLLYLEARDLWRQGFHQSRASGFAEAPIPPDRVRVAGEEYVGTYFRSDSALALAGYSSVRSWMTRRVGIDPRFALFQGLQASRVDAIRNVGIQGSDPSDLAELSESPSEATQDEVGRRVSLFTDGSLLIGAML